MLHKYCQELFLSLCILCVIFMYFMILGTGLVSRPWFCKCKMKPFIFVEVIICCILLLLLIWVCGPFLWLAYCFGVIKCFHVTHSWIKCFYLAFIMLTLICLWSWNLWTCSCLALGNTVSITSLIYILVTYLHPVILWYCYRSWWQEGPLACKTFCSNNFQKFYFGVTSITWNKSGKEDQLREAESNTITYFTFLKCQEMFRQK